MAESVFGKPVDNGVKENASAIAALNSKIAINSNGTTYTKLSDITSMLSGIIATMAENERRIVRITTGTDTSLTPFNPWNDYVGWIAKTNSAGTYWQSHFVGRDGSDVEIGCNNGTISAHSLSSNLTPTTLTFTASHTSISGAERAIIRKSGNVCVIDLSFTVSEDIAGDTVELFSGLPKSIGNETRFRIPHGYSTTMSPLNLAVTKNGKIINQWSSGGIKAGVWAGQAVYITGD